MITFSMANPNVWAGYKGKVVSNGDQFNHNPPSNLLNTQNDIDLNKLKSTNLATKIVIWSIPLAVGICGLSLAWFN